MPTYYQQPMDIQWVYTLPTSLTIYTGRHNAFAAGLALSNANSGAPVQIINFNETLTAPQANGVLKAQVNVVGAGSGLYAVQLQASSTLYPKDQARIAAYALSAANGNVPVYLGRVTSVFTAP